MRHIVSELCMFLLPDPLPDHVRTSTSRLPDLQTYFRNYFRIFILASGLLPDRLPDVRIRFRTLLPAAARPASGLPDLHSDPLQDFQICFPDFRTRFQICFRTPGLASGPASRPPSGPATGPPSGPAEQIRKSGSSPEAVWKRSGSRSGRFSVESRKNANCYISMNIAIQNFYIFFMINSGEIYL